MDSTTQKEAEKPKLKSNKNWITVVSLMLMITAAVTSLRGVPIMSQEELTMFVYLLLAAVLFLIPAALVSAELGTTYAEQVEGVYTWVKEAFNKKTLIEL